MKLIEDYDYTIAYLPGKANVIVDKLSKKSSNSMSGEE